MKDLCETKRNKRRNVTFDLEESLHAESVLKRGESLVKVCQPSDLLKTVSKIKKEKRQIKSLFRVKLTDMMSIMRAAE